MATLPIRGINPIPVEGWSWFLTADEVAYVQAFNVRPLRDASWIGGLEDEARLDLEADGIRSRPNDLQIRTPKGFVRRPRVWFTAYAVITAAFVVCLVLGVFGLMDSIHFTATLTRLRNQ